MNDGNPSNENYQVLKTGKIISWGLMLFGLISCASPQAMPNPDSRLEFRPKKNVFLSPGDVIEVKFRLWPELDSEQTVRPDGKISLQLVDEIAVAGLTPEQLDETLTRLYKSKLKEPEITVIIKSLANQKVFVGGEVETPGVFDLQGDLTALQAVINAGGFKETADPGKSMIIRKSSNEHPDIISVNLKQEINGFVSNQFTYLQPYDVVYVPRSGISNANQFVKHYIKDLLLFNGWGFGFYYEINDNDD